MSDSQFKTIRTLLTLVAMGLFLLVAGNWLEPSPALAAPGAAAAEAAGSGFKACRTVPIDLAAPSGEIGTVPGVLQRPIAEVSKGSTVITGFRSGRTDVVLVCW